MASATIVAGSVQTDGETVTASLRVSEGGGVGNVEYVASTPRKKEDGTNKSDIEVKDDLRRDAKAKRDVQFPNRNSLAGVSGTVTI